MADKQIQGIEELETVLSGFLGTVVGAFSKVFSQERVDNIIVLFLERIFSKWGLQK